MKKKVIFVAALLAFLLVIVAACTNETDNSPVVNTPVEVELFLSIEDNGIRLSWNTQEHVTYDVYRAPSRFASYQIVARSVDSFTDSERFCYYKVAAKNSEGKMLGMSDAVSEETILFGDNVYIFAPTDDPADIRSTINSVYSKMEKAHFTDERYAFFFKPGTYDKNITVRVPFFTTFAGLGASPDDTVVGAINCEGDWNHTSLVNFWRGVENLTFSTTSKWAVSQGTFLRGVHVKGDLYLFDTSTTGDYFTASGGFMADSRVDGKVYSGSQQQWFTRNSEIGAWEGGVWNMVFAGVKNAPQGNVFTSEDSLPIVREKPYLVFENGNFAIKVPSLKYDSRNYEQNNGGERTIPFENIYFARADRDNAATINANIASGKHIVFLPGVYELEAPIVVNRADTVLLGTGLATLISNEGKSCMEIGDVDGVSVAGLLFDAGTKATKTLLKVGNSGGNSQNPIFLYDCFFRVGGNVIENTYAEISLEINANYCVTDNIWLWRADHGDGVGWDVNNGDFGAVINGNNVKCYGLFAEHYKKNNILWKGNGGFVGFYQSEIAYDVPSNERWTSDVGGKGWASFEVAQDVSQFTAFGVGIYSNFWVTGIELDCAMRVPEGSGIRLKYVCAFAMSAKGIVHNVINSDGLFFDQSNISESTHFRQIQSYGGN